MKTKKSMIFWNGRGHGKYEEFHLNVCAYSVAEAGRLIAQACGVNDNFVNEIKTYYSKCWGNDMEGVNPQHPSVYITGKYGKSSPKCVLTTGATENAVDNKSRTVEKEWKVKDSPTGGLVVELGDRFDSIKIIDPAKAHMISASKDMYVTLKKCLQELKFSLANQGAFLNLPADEINKLMKGNSLIIECEKALTKAEGK